MEIRTVFECADSQETRKAGELARLSRTSAAQIRRPELRTSYIIPVLSKAFQIMRLMENSKEPVTINAICEATRIPKSTVYRILRTLSAYGYLPSGSEGIYAFRGSKSFEGLDSKSCGPVTVESGE